MSKDIPGDAVGSLTSHVMWTKPIQSGGVVGGNNFEIQGDTYFEGSAYSQRYTNPIIVNGHLYYNPPLSFLGSNVGPTTCVDLRTGEVIWQRSDVPAISFAMIWDLQNGNQHGVWPALLCTANFARVFDADTGDQLFNVTGVPTGTTVQGPNGEQLRYVISNQWQPLNSKLELSFMELNSNVGRNILPPRNNTIRQLTITRTTQPAEAPYQHLRAQHQHH